MDLPRPLHKVLELLAHLELFKSFEVPVLVGLSRKSMIYKTLKSSPEAALNGTTALHSIALLKGANILRVHDVKEALECITLMENFKIWLLLQKPCTLGYFRYQNHRHCRYHLGGSFAVLFVQIGERTVAINIFIRIVILYVVWKVTEFLQMEMLSRFLAGFKDIFLILIVIVFSRKSENFCSCWAPPT